MKRKSKTYRCFFCDEVFRSRRAAWLHFGDEGCEPDVPACVDPLRHDEQKRMDEVRLSREHAMKYTRENNRLAEKVDDLEYQLFTHDQQLRRYFGNDVTNLWQAGDRYKNVLYELNLIRETVQEQASGVPGRDPECSISKRCFVEDQCGGLASEICRELYDRFVMGGWEPQDAHAQIAALLRSRMAELTPAIVASAGEASGYLCACDSPVAKKIGQQLRAAMMGALPSTPDTERL